MGSKIGLLLSLPLPKWILGSKGGQKKVENKVYTDWFGTFTPYLHCSQILHIFEEAGGKFIHHIIMHKSANTTSRNSLQV